MYRTLSPRELETVKLAVEGLSNQGIANRLRTSRWVVANYLRKAARKLNIQTGSHGATRARLAYWYGKNEGNLSTVGK